MMNCSAAQWHGCLDPKTKLVGRKRSNHWQWPRSRSQPQIARLSVDFSEVVVVDPLQQSRRLMSYSELASCFRRISATRCNVPLFSRGTLQNLEQSRIEERIKVTLSRSSQHHYHIIGVKMALRFYLLLFTIAWVATGYVMQERSRMLELKDHDLFKRGSMWLIWLNCGSLDLLTHRKKPSLKQAVNMCSHSQTGMMKEPPFFANYSITFG